MRPHTQLISTDIIIHAIQNCRKAPSQNVVLRASHLCEHFWCLQWHGRGLVPPVHGPRARSKGHVVGAWGVCPASRGAATGWGLVLAPSST